MKKMRLQLRGLSGASLSGLAHQAAFRIAQRGQHQPSADILGFMRTLLDRQIPADHERGYALRDFTNGKWVSPEDETLDTLADIAGSSLPELRTSTCPACQLSNRSFEPICLWCSGTGWVRERVWPDA